MGYENGWPKAEDTAASAVYDKIAAVFVQNGNKPLGKDEIAQAADIPEGSVHTCVYTVKAAAFVRSPHPQGGNRRAFALTPAALHEAKAA